MLNLRSYCPAGCGSLLEGHAIVSGYLLCGDLALSATSCLEGSTPVVISGFMVIVGLMGSKERRGPVEDGGDAELLNAGDFLRAVNPRLHRGSCYVPVQ